MIARGFLWVSATLALAALLATGCSESPRARRYPERMSIWAEELPQASLDERLGFAGRNRLNVNVSMVKGTHDVGYLTALCGAAERAGVALRLWPGLPRDQGYWANQHNATAYLAWIDELVALAPSACPRLDGFVVDMEMPLDRVDALAAMRAGGASNVTIAMWLLDGIDVAAFDAARAQFAAAARRVRGKGYRFAVSTLAMNADDWRDGDETIAHALWTPIEGIEWDAVSFQVYRNIYDQQFPASGGSYTSGLITSYAHDVVRVWGKRGGIDLGTTGAGIGVTVGLPDAAALVADIAAARAEGIAPGGIGIYSLEGLTDKPDAEAWITLPAPRAAPITELDSSARGTFQSLDLLGN